MSVAKGLHLPNNAIFANNYLSHFYSTFIFYYISMYVTDVSRKISTTLLLHIIWMPGRDNVLFRFCGSFWVLKFSS